jgi:hypothetical protein
MCAVITLNHNEQITGFYDGRSFSTDLARARLFYDYQSAKKALRRSQRRFRWQANRIHITVGV